MIVFLRSAVVFVAVLFVVRVPALSAQGSQPYSPTLFYGVSVGPGYRTTSGTFLVSQLPAGATPPASNRTTGTFGFNIGGKVFGRISAMAVVDQTFGGNTAAYHWGTSNIHAVGRLWLTRRAWIEAGGGASELGYKPPPDMSVATTHFWAPGVQVGVGADVLKGPRVSVSVFGRYSTATFNGLTLHETSVQFGLNGRR